MDLSLLRTFIFVFEEKSVTAAAKRLNRTQPAVSQQIKRLEAAAGVSIFDPDLRKIRLTQHGERLLPYARSMLQMHDEARQRLSCDDFGGRVSLGCPDLYAAFLLPETLASFRRSFVGAEVMVRCALSRQLAEEISEGLIDLAIATRMPGVSPRVAQASVLRSEALVWLGAENGSAHLCDPLPLALLPEGNLYRDHALAALNHAGRSWRIACVSESIAGLQAMTLADTAVTVLARSVRTPGLRLLERHDGVPALPSVDLMLWQREAQVSGVVRSLSDHIIRHVGS